MSKVRYHSLDSLRGIASLQVLIAHSLVAVPLLAVYIKSDIKNQAHNFSFFITHSPISFLWSDSAAVKVFFMLSGFVLSLPYYNVNKNIPYYPGFFIKRIIRLYLPCFAIILISLLAQLLLYTPNKVNDFGPWIQLMWTLPNNASVLFNLFILNNYLDYFDRALWTLPPEIKLSLILPLIIFLLKPMRKVFTLVTVIIYIMAWHTLNKMGARNVWPDFPTLYYFTFFIGGSVICKYRLEITNWINSFSRSKYYLFLVLTLYVYTFKYSFFWLPTKIYNPINSVTDYVSAVAAVMLLCIVLSERAHGFFNSKALLFLGKISFSIYLIHIVVITIFAYLLTGLLSPAIIVILAMVCCFPLSILFYNYVEVPSLNFANYCSKVITDNHYVKKILRNK